MSGESDRGSSSHLRIQAITVPVTDLVRSLEFVETVLVFRIIQQVRLPASKRLGFVAPPDGAAILVLGEADSNGRDRGARRHADRRVVRHRQHRGALPRVVRSRRTVH
jgi:hypothetical protein